MLATGAGSGASADAVRPDGGMKEKEEECGEGRGEAGAGRVMEVMGLLLYCADSRFWLGE